MLKESLLLSLHCQQQYQQLISDDRDINAWFLCTDCHLQSDLTQLEENLGEKKKKKSVSSEECLCKMASMFNST